MAFLKPSCCCFSRLFAYACALGRRRERLKDSTLRAYLRKLEAKLDVLMARIPVVTASVKLQRAIKKCRRHLFVFMTNRDLSPTNNGSERIPYPAKPGSSNVLAAHLNPW